MARASSQVDGPECKRRKVRKGTQSCWNCRRRKVRCIFTTASDDVCENCRRRETVCISQEHPDEFMPSASSNPVVARIGRVEELVEHLINSAETAHIPNSPSKNLSEGHLTQIQPKTASHAFNTDEPTRPRPRLKRSLPAITTSPVQSQLVANKYEDLSGTLIAAWPSEHDIDLICSLPVGLSAYLHGGISTPYSSSMAWDPPSPREMLQLPPPSSHPVLIARKLLVLGVFLQGVLPSSIRGLADLDTSYRDIMSHVVDTAIRLVTTNEDLISSVEGIECIMIEAMYQNYAGSLHRAWMAVRRATTVAQMMALHRGLKSPSLNILEPGTRAAFNPDQICFRLLEMDYYLSLMLGLPQASLEARFATPKALEECQPVDRMQRIHCNMANRILQRDEKNLSDTHDIDTLLQKAAAEMPPQWWLIPDLSAVNSGGTQIFHETVRLMDQLSHYHLLIRLHLPYLLRFSANGEYDHSKITVVNASRETLARYIAFRTSNPAHFYCRGTDFLAFIATTVLCLAHINSHTWRQEPARNSNPDTLFSFLIHSRSDRGMMERSLDIIEAMACAGTDAISSKIARIIRHLLAIEANAASGASYNTNTSKGSEEELECNGKLTSGGKRLHVYIPYFGTINFEHSAISKPVSTAPPVPKQALPTTLVTEKLLPNQPSENSQNPPSSSDYSQACQITNPLDYSNSQTVQLQLCYFGPPQQLQSPSNSVSNFISSNIQEGQLAASTGLTGSEDDWDLQGVDIALFDSLFRGTVIPDVAEEEAWEQFLGS